MIAAAFFDMDGTLLRGESQFSFLIWCLRRGLVSQVRTWPVFGRYLMYLTGISRDAGHLRKAGFGLFAQVEVNVIERAGEEFFRNHLFDRIRRHAEALVRAHKNAGHHLVLITSAVEAVAHPVAVALGIDHLIATRMKSRCGRYTGEWELPEPYGAEKRDLAMRYCADRGIVPEACYAYSDHHTDLALLEAVGHPRAVHPTRILREILTDRGWPRMNLDGGEFQQVVL